MLLAKCVTRSHLSVQLFKLLGMARAEDGWRTVPLTSPSGCMRVPLQLLCSSILRRRRRSPMKRLSFVACRLSRLSPRTYLKDLAGAGGTVGTVGALAVQKAKRRRGLAWTLERLRAHTQVSPGSWAGTSLPLSLSLFFALSLFLALGAACIACLETIIYVCLGSAMRSSFCLLLLLLGHVCILIFKRAYVEFTLGMLEPGASELRVDGAESDTSHKFLLCPPTDWRDPLLSARCPFPYLQTFLLNVDNLNWMKLTQSWAGLVWVSVSVWALIWPISIMFATFSIGHIDR